MNKTIFSKRREFRELYSFYKTLGIKSSKKYHILYKTTNKINGKIYIGRHSTDDLNDGYIGSGVDLLKEVANIGYSNFKRDIIRLMPDFESLCALEKIILTQEFVSDKSNYNLGFGGFGLVTHSDETKKRIKKVLKTKSKIISENTKRAVSTPDARKANSLRQLSLPNSVKKSRADKSREVRQTPESRLRTSLVMKKAYKNNPELALSTKIRLNRPWKVRNQYMDLTNSRFSVIDKVYDIYIKYDFTIKGSLTQFEDEIKSIFNFYPTRAIYSYLDKHGDPRLDDEWLLWIKTLEEA